MWSFSHLSIHPAFNDTFNSRFVLLQSDGVPIKECVGMDEDEWRRLVYEHRLSPIDIFPIHLGKILIVRATTFSVGRASEYVQV
jgi:hypothetical protein